MYIPVFPHRSPGVKRGRLMVSIAALVLGLVMIVSPNFFKSIPVNSPVTTLNEISLPSAFVPNMGQADTAVQFQTHDSAGTIFFTSHEVVLALPGDTSQALHVQFLGNNSQTTVSGVEALPGTVNYILGDSPAQWQTDIPTYEGIIYEQLYPGIDLRYEGTNGRLKGTYHLAAGADPGLIRWQHSGASAVSLDKTTGQLHIALPGAAPELIEEAPVAWQEIAGQRVPVAIQYSLAADGSAGFALGAYDTAYPLIIDPTLVYSASLGGSQFENASGIAIDGTGNAYIVGMTDSSDFPIGNALGVGNGFDVLVVKVNAAGDGLVYSTYIGGSNDDEGAGIVVDDAGNAYVTGTTDSTDFPTVDPIQNSHQGLDDAFVLKLNPAGNGLLYGTYLGGSGVDTAEAIALADSGAAYVIGTTTSTNFPTKNAYDGQLSGVADAFVVGVASDGSDWAFATYLGGSGLESGADIATDPAGNVTVTGATLSTNFPTKNAYQPDKGGNYDLFVTRFAAGGSSLLYSTYLGGDDADYAYGLALMATGNVVITGETYSGDFPVMNPIHSNQSGTDAFVTTLSNDGQALVGSTYLGGSGDDKGFDVAVDANDDVYVTGSTYATDFPTERPLQANISGGADAFVAKLTGGTLAYSTYLGGSGADNGHGITVDEMGDAYVTGITESGNFPAGVPLAASPGGVTDVFVVKISDEGDEEIPPVADSNLAGSAKTASHLVLGPNEELTFTIRLHNSGLEATTATVTDALPDELVYVTGSVTGGGTYDAGTHTLSWSAVPVANGADALLTFEVTADVDEPTVVVNTAVITPADKEPFERSTAVLLSPVKVTEDIIPPVVYDLIIGSEDVLTSREVTLHINASDNVGVEWMYLREWQLTAAPFPHWQVVQSSGWIPYEPTPTWTMGNASGTHFVAVWVADAAHNTSLLTIDAADSASLLLPQTTVAEHGFVPYLVHYESGEDVTATLTPSSGDADLYVWYPGSSLAPDEKSTNGGTAVDTVSFTTPSAGMYLFLVYGDTSATYDFSIVPGGVARADDVQVTAKTAELGAEPVLQLAGLDPLAVAQAPGSPNTLYLPLVFAGQP